MRPTILVKILLIASVLAVNSAAEEGEMLSALASQLMSEPCGLYMLGLSSTHLSELSRSLAKSFSVVADARSLSSLKDSKRFECLAIVHVARKVVKREKLGNLFRRQYVIDLGKDLQFENVQDLVFNLPASIFTADVKGGVVSVSLFCPHAHQELRVVNVWKSGTGFLIPLANNHQSCPNSLQNQLVEVTAFGLPPYILTSPKKEMGGIDVDVLGIIAKKMRLNYRVTFGGTWGNKVNETTWTGITGKVVTGEADIGIGHVIMNDERKAVVDFTSPLYNENLYFISTKPKAKSPVLNLVSPFQLSVWLALLGSLAAATATVLLIEVIFSDAENHWWQNSTACYRVQLIQSGVTLTSLKRSPYVLFGFWCIFAYFINAFYFCNFRSYLTQVEYEKPVETAEDMVGLGRDVYLSTGSIYQSLFRDSPNAAMRELFRSYDKKGLCYSYVNGFLPKSTVKEMIGAGGGFLMAKYPGTIYLKTFDKMYGYIPMRLGKTVMFTFYSGFMVAKRSPWKDEMDMIILRLIQGGIISRSEDDSISPRYLTEEPPDTSPKPFQILHICGSLFVLLVGVTLSCIAFLIEKTIFNVSNAGTNSKTAELKPKDPKSQEVLIPTQTAMPKPRGPSRQESLSEKTPSILTVNFKE